jgi:hypothetical protein
MELRKTEPEKKKGKYYNFSSSSFSATCTLTLSFRRLPVPFNCDRMSIGDEREGERREREEEKINKPWNTHANDGPRGNAAGEKRWAGEKGQRKKKNKGKKRAKKKMTKKKMTPRRPKAGKRTGDQKPRAAEMETQKKKEAK